jgi:sensor histidine kinase YesM
MNHLFPNSAFGRYLIVGSAFLWFSIHTIFTQVQFGFAKGTERESTWLEVWLQLSPWFLNWIWMTVIIFFATYLINKQISDIKKRVLMHLLLMTFLLFVYWAMSSLISGLINGRGLDVYFSNLLRVVSTSSQIDVLIYFAMLFISLGIQFYHSVVEEKIALKKLQHLLVAEQLKTLHSQLNPHFLFNALNTISSLVRLKREKEAVKALSELSQMLRRILENKSNEDVKVKDEIAFINSYLSIQKMRFTDKLESRIFVAEDCLELEIPSMLIHPLIENAVQHGSQLESNNNLLNLEIVRKDNTLNICLTNKVVNDDRHEGFGIGLSHTKERLDRLYDDYQFQLNPDKNGMFETMLSIPIGGRSA